MAKPFIVFITRMKISKLVPAITHFHAHENDIVRVIWKMVSLVFIDINSIDIKA